MTLSPEERARLIVKVLDTVLTNVFPSEDEMEAMAPHVDHIRKRYGELRGKSFQEASIASRAEFIATAIRDACNEKLEWAADLVERVAQSQASGWRENPKEDGCGGSIAASNTGFLAAQVIREKKDTTP